MHHPDRFKISLSTLRMTCAYSQENLSGTKFWTFQNCLKLRFHWPDFWSRCSRIAVVPARNLFFNCRKSVVNMPEVRTMSVRKFWNVQNFVPDKFSWLYAQVILKVLKLILNLSGWCMKCATCQDCQEFHEYITRISSISGRFLQQFTISFKSSLRQVYALTDEFKHFPNILRRADTQITRSPDSHARVCAGYSLYIERPVHYSPF